MPEYVIDEIIDIDNLVQPPITNEGRRSVEVIGLPSCDKVRLPGHEIGSVNRAGGRRKYMGVTAGHSRIRQCAHGAGGIDAAHAAALDNEAAELSRHISVPAPS